MDAAQILIFATALLETAKTLANNGAYHDECARLANRAADLFDKALKAVDEPHCIWTVWLVSYGDRKIQCIKGVREFTNLGLKEAKELVEACPCALLETEDVGLAREFYEQLQLTRDSGYADRVKPSVELRKAYPIKKQEVVERCGSESPLIPLPSCPDEYPE
jgi:ribosomal protein L7/L12